MEGSLVQLLDRKSMRKAAAAYLRPGETLQCVFSAQTTSGYGSLTGAFPGPVQIISWFTGARNRYRIFAVTDQRVLVLDAGPLNASQAYGVVAELPRSTPLGPPTGLFHVINVKDEKLRVGFPWFKDIQKADAERPRR